MARSSFLIQWDAHEYEHKERSQDWFWAVGIITISITVASIIFGNIIFAILVLVGTFALSLFINRPPETIHIEIDETGITKGNVRYPYESLSSFWIDSEHSHPKILLKSEKTFMPLIIVPIDHDIDMERLNRTLLRFLREEYHSPPFVEKVLEYLGF